MFCLIYLLISRHLWNKGLYVLVTRHNTTYSHIVANVKKKKKKNDFCCLFLKNKIAQIISVKNPCLI